MSRMTKKGVFSILAFVGIAGCLGIITSCSSRHISDFAEPLPTSITLERQVHFVNSKGDATQVQPGTYEVSTIQDTLQLYGESTDNLLPLQTHTFTHKESIEAPTPLSFMDREDEHVVMLLYPDGTALEAVGSYSGIQSRAIRRRLTRRSPAIIKQQFRRAVLINRARLKIASHFTFRVPVQLNNLSSDINRVKIRCWTHIGNDATAYQNRIGEGEAVANVTNRQFNGTIVVRFNANQGKEPEDADRYNCSMLFHKPGIGFRQPGKFGTPLGNQKPAWLVSANGTSFRIHAQGGVNS